MKGRFKKLFSSVMAASVVLSMGAGINFQLANAADTELHNPVVEMNTCDTIYFGNYWQEDTNGDGVADQNDEKTPIRWRILSRNGNDAYVMADQALDCKPYHEREESVTWETSTLRKWLNEEFYQEAFSVVEKEEVLEQTLVNVDIEGLDTESGEDMVDYVCLPSLDDILREDYGFSSSTSADSAKSCRATAYAEQQGALTWWTGKECRWWLCTLGIGRALYVGYESAVRELLWGWDGFYSSSDSIAVRPALHLNLSSPLVRQGDKIEISQKCASWDLVELGSYAGKPITWRVLSVSGNDVFLLSDQILTDDREYHETQENITWKDSTLRIWLNREFYQKIFLEEEKAGICSYLYENENNPQHGTEGGEDTRDYITLLSLQDIVNPKYGFPMINCGSPARVAYDNDGNARFWWLRSPGCIAGKASYVYDYGYGDSTGTNVSNSSIAIRPALHLDLSIYPLTKVGTVTATAEGNKYQENISAPTDDVGNPQVTLTPATTVQPSNLPSPTDHPESTEKPDRTPDAYHTPKPKDTPLPEKTVEPECTSEPEEIELPDPSEKPDQNDNDDLTDDMSNRDLKVRGLDIATDNVVKKGFLSVPRVQLTWDNNRNCDGYEIWRKEGNKSFVKVDYIDDSDEVEWFDTNLKKGCKYTYKVLGYVEEDDGTISRAKDGNSVSVKVRQTVKSCTYTAKRTGKKLKITFKKAEGTKYQIQVKYGKSKKWKKASGSLKKKIVKKVSPKKLKVRVRTSEKVNGKMKYSKWSKVKTVR